MATMKDVAVRAGVSVSTVSHVLNGTRVVAEETGERVRAAVAELGYRENLLAKGLKTRRTFTIGLLISDIQNPFFTSVVRGVEDAALRRGYHVFLCNTDENPEREEEYIIELDKKRVDGLIVASSAPRHNHARRLREEEVPFVFMDRVVESVEADVIRVNNRAGMRAAADHLVDLGHRRIGMVSGPLDLAPGYERYHGLKEALEELGVGLDESLVRFGDFMKTSGQKGAEELLGLGEPPTALVTANNQMTLGAMLAVRQLGVKIPDELSLVGFDDVEWAPLADPPLTAVAQPTYDLGYGAGEMLLDRIEGVAEDGRRVRLLDPWLVVRDSTMRLGDRA